MKQLVWHMKWQSTLVFLPGKLHGQRSLVGYCPWGRKELDTTEKACMRILFHEYTGTEPRSSALQADSLPTEQ